MRSARQQDSPHSLAGAFFPVLTPAASLPSLLPLPRSSCFLATRAVVVDNEDSNSRVNIDGENRERERERASADESRCARLVELSGESRLPVADTRV